jgi:hypothetical protein
MKPMSERPGTDKQPALCEVEATELVAITGGSAELEARVYRITNVRANASSLGGGGIPAGVGIVGTSPVIAH